MQRKTISLENDSVQTLVWVKDRLVDFANGLSFFLDNNEPDHLGFRLGFNFDAAIVSDEAAATIKKNQIAIWDLKNNIEIHTLTLDRQIGQFIVVSESIVIDLYQYPKLINFKTGELMGQFPDINSGLQRSSIIHHLNDLPKIAWNSKSKQLAIGSETTIEVLSF